jgi:hypothetical protein
VIRQVAKAKKKAKPLVIPERHRELAFRPTLDGWSPEKVKQAADAADAGNLQDLADLCDAILRDDRVDGVLDTRTHGLLGLPLTFVGGSESMQGELAGEKGAPGQWWKQHPEAELVKLMRWGMMLGVGLTQRVPQPRFGEAKPKYKLETWSPRWLTYDANATKGRPEWSITTAKGNKSVAPGAGSWILYTPFGSKRPWAEGKWAKIVFPWLLKRYALEDRANLGQQIGKPTWVGRSPKGATERQRNKFLSQLVALGKQGRLVLPDGWDLVLKEAEGKTWEIYSEAIEWADAAITIVLAGQVVTTEGSPGFNSGNVQERIVGDLIRFDAESLATCMQEQSLTPLAWEWEDNGDNAPYPVWDTKRPPDKEQEGRTYEIVGRSIELWDKALAADGKRIDAVRLAERLNLELKPVEKEDAKPTEKIALAPTDVARAITLNEVRANNGLPPLVDESGNEDPRGKKLMSELSEQAEVEQAEDLQEIEENALPDQSAGPPSPEPGNL